MIFWNGFKTWNLVNRSHNLSFDPQESPLTMDQIKAMAHEMKIREFESNKLGYPSREELLMS